MYTNIFYNPDIDQDTDEEFDLERAKAKLAYMIDNGILPFDNKKADDIATVRKSA